MDGAISVQLFGCKVGPNKTVKLNEEDNDTKVTTIQITQVALGEKPGKKRCVVYCGDGEREWVMGSLLPNQVEQFQTDYMGRHQITLRHTGEGDVFVSGFKTVTLLEDDDEDDFEGMPGSDSDEEDEEEEEDDDDARLMLANGRSKKGNAADSDDDEESDEEDDDEDGPGGLDVSDEDDEDMEDDDEEDDEDDEEDDEDEDDDEEDEDDEDEEAAPPAKGNKRPAAATPQQQQQQQAKKAKAAAGEGGDVAAYEKALKTFLKEQGPTSLSTIGSAVKPKPANIKLRNFIQDRTKLFKIDGAGKVHLA